MKIWVLDASVVVKWFMTDAENESDLMKALELLTALRNDNLQVLQPVHWLIEVAAVITRYIMPLPFSMRMQRW
jgi:predicted nucleic acid-binding protein